MRTKAQALTIMILGATLVIASAQTTQTTATAPAPAPPPLSPTEQRIKEIKNPAPWLTWGGDFRARNEYFNNLLTLSDKNSLHEQDYFRFRARLWASVTPVEDLTFYSRLAAEPREWMRPAGYTVYRPNSGLDMREGIVDNLNVEYKNIAGSPVTIKVGRQDVVPGRDSLAGDGWLLSDGTPNDGSWTYYFDAARLKYELIDQHTTIEAMGIFQDPLDDAWMPTINNQNLAQGDQREEGAVVQVANSSYKAANMTGYFIYKHDDMVSTSRYGGTVAQAGDNADIYTFGGRLNGALDDHWQYWLEGAYQFGRKADPKIKYPSGSSSASRDLSAYGVNTKLSYLFKDKLSNQLALSVELLSGDDPKTGSDEMFDSLWGRWPRWSEIGLYSYAAEARIGQQANLLRFGPTWTLNPIKDMKFATSYYALFSQQDEATRGAPGLFSNNDNFRGHFVSAMVEYTFSRHMKGHLWGELLFPGDYYVSNEMISFVRAEVMFTF